MLRPPSATAVNLHQHARKRPRNSPLQRLHHVSAANLGVEAKGTGWLRPPPRGLRSVLLCAEPNSGEAAPAHTECKVYLVGSGVGSVEFLTVRAKELLERADAVVYDALADGDLLPLVPPHCERYYVGKRGGAKGTSTAQEDIEALLLRLAAQPDGPRTVVRLKAGDPFIFGRSRGECLALQNAGVEVEVVPGLSSALAAPLLAGVALTDGELSSSFVVLTASKVGGAFPDTLHEVRGAETVVILMGGARVGELSAALQEAGRPPHTPVLVVKWAGHRDKQEEWRGTLADIAARTAGTSLSPAVIIVGPTAARRLAPSLAPAPPPLPAPPAQPEAAEGGGRGGEAGSAREGTRRGANGSSSGSSSSSSSSSGSSSSSSSSSGGGGGGVMAECDCFLLDMDGVLWAGGHTVPGSLEAVSRLRAAGKRVLFVTNNSAKSRHQVADSLRKRGFEVSVDDVVTSGWAAARFLKAKQVTRAYVVGAAGLREELSLAGVHPVYCEAGLGLDEAGFAALQLDPAVQAVVSGWDVDLSWRKIAVASAYLHNASVLFVGTNPDPANRVAGKMMPENGAQLAALEAVAGRKAVVAGKPSSLLVSALVRRYGLDPRRTVMVGDRLDTDIAFGHAGGLKTLLVLTGVTRAEEAARFAAEGWAQLPPDQRPDYVLPDLLAATARPEDQACPA